MPAPPKAGPPRVLAVHRSFLESNGWGATSGTTVDDGTREGRLEMRYRVEVEPEPLAPQPGPAAPVSRGQDAG